MLQKTLNIIQGPNAIINPNHLTDYLYSEKQPRLFYNMIGDSNYIFEITHQRKNNLIFV